MDTRDPNPAQPDVTPTSPALPIEPDADAPLTISAWFRQNAGSLLFMVAVLILVFKYTNPITTVATAIGLGLVIFIHELGHFAAAKLCDVHVETFSIGFGPALPGCRYRYGETVYMLALIPLGGYVKMLGEGSENEEGEEDPRSFKNKTVWQRMIIISAGVIMNMILAAICFVFVYMTRGVEELPAVVTAVSPGSPAWQANVRSGDAITQISDTANPSFDDIKPIIMSSPRGERIPLTLQRFRYVQHRPVEPSETLPMQIAPRRDEENNPLPVFGVAMPTFGRLVLRSDGRKPPQAFYTDTAAAQAVGSDGQGFLPGDRILGTTDPASKQVTELPFDPRAPALRQRDYFAFRQRMVDLAGQEVVIRIRRKGVPDDGPTVDLTVPAAYTFTLTGLRMRVGEITAVRDDSPAARAGVRPRQLDAKIRGDILKAVEVNQPDGKKLRFVVDTPKPESETVRELALDPVRLPFELTRWAQTATDRTVQLSVARDEGHGILAKVQTLTATWDDSWRYNDERPSSPQSPLTIPGLGLAYRVETVIESVQPDTPAEKAGLLPGDKIKEVQFFYFNAQRERKAEPWIKLKDDQWAGVYEALQLREIKEVLLKVERPSGPVAEPIALTADPDPTWPAIERGWILEPDVRLQKADTVWEALELGAHRTKRTVTLIYANLWAMVTARIPLWSLSGPLSIAERSYSIAEQDFFRFILFLGMINVNLAIVNFLPIPVLDGGHMVFLTYELLRGKPPSERVRMVTTIAGFAFIVSLMLFVIALDVQRYFF